VSRSFVVPRATAKVSLSPIDTVGANFFKAVQSCGTTTTGPQLRFLLSGHDVERWLLRTLAIFGVSRNFAIDGAVIDQELIERLRIVERLENIHWSKPLGLYLLGGNGHRFDQRSDVQLAPITRKDNGKLVGITLDIQGLALGLLAAEHELRGAGLDRALYRPGSLVFDMEGVQHRIQLCWEDQDEHQDVTLSLQQRLIAGAPAHPQ
jgi:hypothetical protein